ISGDPQPEIYEPIGQDVEEMGDGGHQMGPSAEEPAAAGGESVAILEGSSTFQDANAPDEFADSEDPADYSVNVLRVQPGTTVTWTNQDAMIHTVTAVDGSFDSGFLNPGDTFS